MASDFKTAQPVEFYTRFLKEDVRPDGRSLREFRKTLLNVDSVSTAEGSALIKLGNTTVICGIKAEVAEPTLNFGRSGYIVPNVELPPLCSPRIRPGPQNEQAQVSTQFLLETIENSNLVDLSDLCIVENKFVWCIYADLICLNYDGNLQDACLTALLAALHNCQLPTMIYDEEKDELEANADDKTSLKISHNPVACTFGIFDQSQLIADPTGEEEMLVSSVITIVTLEDGKLCSVFKPGGCPVKDDIIHQCIARSLPRGQEVRSLIDALTLPAER
eukprot:gene7009-7794_t